MEKKKCWKHGQEGVGKTNISVMNHIVLSQTVIFSESSSCFKGHGSGLDIKSFGYAMKILLRFVYAV